MARPQQAVLARLKRVRERRRESARLRAALGLERDSAVRELIALIRRTLARRRSERN